MAIGYWTVVVSAAMSSCLRIDAISGLPVMLLSHVRRETDAGSTSRTGFTRWQEFPLPGVESPQSTDTEEAPAMTRMGDALERNKFWWEMAKGFAIGFGAVYSFMANQTSEAAKGEVEAARAVLEARTQQTQFDIKAYELVEKAISSSAAVRRAQGLAAAAIVNALTSAPLRDQLQNALRAGLNDPELIRMLDAARQFDAEQEEIPVEAPSTVKRVSWRVPGFDTVFAQPTNGALQGFRVDLFYCESATAKTTAARKARADKGLSALKNTGAPARVRLLPSLVQARPGYQSFADEVRYSEGAAELAAARELSRLLGLKPESIKKVSTRTVGYLSAFFCAQ